MLHETCINLSVDEMKQPSIALWTEMAKCRETCDFAIQASLFWQGSSSLADGRRCHTFRLLQPPPSEPASPERGSLQSCPLSCGRSTPERATCLSRGTAASSWLSLTIYCIMPHQPKGKSSSGTSQSCSGDCPTVMKSACLCPYMFRLDL